MIELNVLRKNKTDIIIHKLPSPRNSLGEKQFKYERGAEYWLMIIGYAIGYGSFWRFPYLVYTCG